MFELKKSQYNEYINKTFRLPSIIVDKLEDLSSEYNLSVNKIVIQCIEYALNDMKHQNNDNVSDNTSNDII
ncbi:MAG: hypothetical protein HFE59_03135 [Clostridiales bacterium]|jgi:predicted DNA-binding protein|nr:hypothetical protein [Clostridiales bacterium]